MSKSNYQITKFLEQHNFKSEIDWKGISSFCKLELDTNLDDIEPSFSPDGIDFSIFSLWYSGGYGSGDIARYNGKLVIVGACNIDIVKIEATLDGDKVDCTRYEARVLDLSESSESDMDLFKKALVSNELQFDENRQLVIERYIPGTNERISFKNDNSFGIGVVRSVSKESNTFELYCYYIYKVGTVKYSMHESIGPLSDYTFQIMTRSERNKLKNELIKFGKCWNDKMHRIEPINGKAKIGEKYWYINDKMKMVDDIEEGKKWSHSRFLGGNYFLTQSDCLDSLGRISEMLRDNLAR